jgi:5-methylcytosine-specific restriction endonuclease McrA
MGGSYDRTKYRKGRVVTCKICGKEFYRSYSELKKNKTGNIYCSSGCYQSTIQGEGNPNFNNHWTDESKKALSEKQKLAYANGRKSWCKGQTKETDPRLAKCGVPGNDFGKYSKGSKRPDNIWRNVLNSAGVRHGLQQEHKYKYHGENWLIIRKSVLQRDNFTCQKCGSKDELVAHHLIPYRLGGSDDLENLITLCRKCHGREEPGARKRATTRRH